MGDPLLALPISGRDQQVAPPHREEKNSGGNCTKTHLCRWVWTGGTAKAPWLCWGPWAAATASAPQVIVTGMLQLCLFAITDNGNNPALQGTQALVIGILIVIIGVSLGMNSGYAINPSRDLPPRFFTFLAGWGTQVFRYCPAQPMPSDFP